MKAFIWTIIGLGVGAGIVLGAGDFAQGTQPTYIIRPTQPATTSVAPAPITPAPVTQQETPLPGGNNLCMYEDDCGGGVSEPTPYPSDGSGPPMEVPCYPINQDDTGNCGTYGVIPYPPGDPRLGVPANPTPTPVPESPWTRDWGPHLV